MNNKFEEWRATTEFAKKSFFESYVRYIKSLELSNKPSEFVYEFQLKKMRTTPLMSRLNHTCKDGEYRIESLIINIGRVNIVVIHGLPYKYGFISNQGGSWTMTELKQDGYLAFDNIDKDRTIRKTHWDENTWLKIWSIPLHLRAVTNGDKDFRKEFEGGYLVYEGNQYGDTSDFYIIGSLEKKKK